MLWWKIWKLKRQLKSKLGSERWDAAQELGKIGNKRAVEPLIVALNDDVSNVRYHAAEALEKLGDKRAIEPLIVALKDSDSNVRYHAAKALEKLGDKRAIEPLIAALMDSDSSVRRYAAKALKALKYEPADEPQKVMMFVARSDWDNVVKLGVVAVDSLIVALKDSDKDVRPEAAKALGKIGDVRAIEPLIDALKDWASREEAAEALGKIGDIRAVEPLIAMLKDSGTEVQGIVAETLGNIGDKRAVKPLIALLKDKNLGVRVSAAEALGKIGTPEAKQAVSEYKKQAAKKKAEKEKLERKNAATIKLNNTAENRYLKQVFDHLKEFHRNTSFGYHDIPDPSPELLDTARQAMESSDTIFLSSGSEMVKSHIMVLMKSLGLRESVGLGSFSLTNKAHGTIIELY